MTHEVILFTSPKAGSGAAREQIPRLIDRLAAGGRSVTETCVPDELRDRINRCRETGVPRPLVIAAGGDGTISLVASNTDAETPLLPMPLGTENLLARHFGQTNDADAVVNTVESGRQIQIDAGRADGRIFLIMATAGFDAEVVRELHQNRRGHIRRLSYLMPILQTISRYRFPKLAVHSFDGDGQTVDRRDVAWAMVFNLPCYAAGLQISPDAIGDDGLLDLISFGRRGVLNGIRYLLGIVSGGHQRLSDVDQRRVARVKIECPSESAGPAEVAYELDGDYAGQLPVEIEVLPARVRLIVPG